MIKRAFYYTIILSVVALQLSSCAMLYQGCPVDKNQILKLKEESNESQDDLSQDKIQDLLGEPNIKNDDNWYYMYRKFSKVAFFTPKLLEQQIVKLHFENNNLVNFEVLDHIPEKISIVKFDTKPVYSNYTKWKHFTKNIGRKYKKSK